MNDKNSKSFPPVLFVSLGLVFGVIIGSLTGDIGLWLPIGVALGAGLMTASGGFKQDEDQKDD